MYSTSMDESSGTTGAGVAYSQGVKFAVNNFAGADAFIYAPPSPEAEEAAKVQQVVVNPEEVAATRARSDTRSVMVHYRLYEYAEHRPSAVHMEENGSRTITFTGSRVAEERKNRWVRIVVPPMVARHAPGGLRNIPHYDQEFTKTLEDELNEKREKSYSGSSSVGVPAAGSRFGEYAASAASVHSDARSVGAEGVAEGMRVFVQSMVDDEAGGPSDAGDAVPEAKYTPAAHPEDVGPRVSLAWLTPVYLLQSVADYGPNAHLINQLTDQHNLQKMEDGFNSSQKGMLKRLVHAKPDPFMPADEERREQQRAAAAGGEYYVPIMDYVRESGFNDLSSKYHMPKTVITTRSIKQGLSRDSPKTGVFAPDESEYTDNKITISMIMQHIHYGELEKQIVSSDCPWMDLVRLDRRRRFQGESINIVTPHPVYGMFFSVTTEARLLDRQLYNTRGLCGQRSPYTHAAVTHAGKTYQRELPAEVYNSIWMLDHMKNGAQELAPDLVYGVFGYGEDMSDPHQPSGSFFYTGVTDATINLKLQRELHYPSVKHQVDVNIGTWGYIRYKAFCGMSLFTPGV